MNRLLLLLASILLPLCCLADEPFEVRIYKGSDGASLRYRLLRPESTAAGVKYPVVLFLHGAGERGEDNAAQLKHCVSIFTQPPVRAKYPCYVVVPQVPTGQLWADIDWTKTEAVMPADPTPSMRNTLEALAELEKEFPIDSERRYISGISMGGYGTWDALCRKPDHWAAAVPICGGGDPAMIARAAKVPIWVFHGDADRAVAVAHSRRMVAALRAAGGSPLYSEYARVDHNSWTPAYQEPDLLPWLFAQRLGKPVTFTEVAGTAAQPPSENMTASGPVQPGVWFRGLWKGHRADWAAHREQGAVVFFGDSITEGWKTLARDFDGMQVANRGISGDTTRGLLERLEGDVLALHPRAVSLLIGTNDLSLGAEPELVAENLRTIVSKLKASNPQLPVVVNKVMPRGAATGLFPDKIRRLNALIETAFANDPQVTLCDTWTLFDDGSGTCRKAEFPDMLHPNAEGYALWTKALKAVFAKLRL